MCVCVYVCVYVCVCMCVCVCVYVNLMKFKLKRYNICVSFNNKCDYTPTFFKYYLLLGSNSFNYPLIDLVSL